jgi:hypothetical protein
VPKRPTTHLEHLGAPAWSRWVSLCALAGILVVNLGVITFVWSRHSGGARTGLLIALLLLALLALALLIRGWNTLRRDSRAHGAGSNAT